MVVWITVTMEQLCLELMRLIVNLENKNKDLELTVVKLGMQVRECMGFVEEMRRENDSKTVEAHAEKGVTIVEDVREEVPCLIPTESISLYANPLTDTKVVVDSDLLDIGREFKECYMKVNQRDATSAVLIKERLGEYMMSKKIAKNVIDKNMTEIIQHLFGKITQHMLTFQREDVDDFHRLSGIRLRYIPETYLEQNISTSVKGVSFKEGVSFSLSPKKWSKLRAEEARQSEELQSRVMSGENLRVTSTI